MDQRSRDWAGAILPTWALVRRDLVSLLRQPSAFWMAGLVVFVGLAFTLISWPSMQHQFQQRLAYLARYSNEHFTILLFVLMIAVGLFIPALSGSAIVTERRGRTFEQLAVTHAGPASYLLAKLITSVGYFLLTTVALLPILGLNNFLVGLNAATWMQGFHLLVLAAFTVASAGLWCSSRFQRPVTAVGVSYLITLFLTGMPFILALVVYEELGFRQMFFINPGHVFTIGTCGFIPLAQLHVVNGGRNLGFDTVLFFCTVVNGSVGVLYLLLAYRHLRRTWGLAAHDAASTCTRFRRAEKPRPTYPPIPDDGNPLLIRENRYGMRVGRRDGLYIFCSAMGTSLLACVFLYSSPFGSYRIAQGWLMLAICLACAALPILVAHLFGREREDDTLDALRMTLLGDKGIVGAKLRVCVGLVIVLWFAIALPHVPVLFAELIESQDEYLVTTGLITLAVVLLLSGMVTMLLSLLLRRLTSVLVASYAVMTMIIIGNFALVMLTYELLGGRWHRIQHGSYNLFALLSPWIAYGNVANSFRYNRPQWWAWSEAMVLYGGLTVLLAVACYAVFQRRIYRAR